MNIEIKEAAIEQLRKVDYKENEDDERFIIDGVPLLISSESKKHLPDKVFLNYSDGLGYKLYSDEETLRYNLQLNRVNFLK